MESSWREKGKNGRMFVGGLLITIGALLLLQRFDYITIGPIWQYWPFIFVAIGIGKIANDRHPREIGEGIWWIFLGLWLYVSIQHVFGLSFRETWPAVLIAWGAGMIWRSYFSTSYRGIRG